MHLPLVSLIVPVYNAALFLSKSLDSILSQTYEYVEVIFVNDCSTDNSEQILLAYKAKIELSKPNYIVKILNHTSNKGVATARNTALDNANGDYLYYLDADDYLSRNTIELLVNEAEFSKVDIVGCSWVLQFESSGRVMHQPIVSSPNQALEYMCKGVMRWNLWLFLVKRELYVKSDVRFVDGQNMGEDMMVMFKLISKARSISILKSPLYFYFQANSDSLTKVYSSLHKKEVGLNLSYLDKYCGSLPNIDWTSLFNYLKLNIKLPLLISSKSENYKEWASWFPESTSYCLKNDKISKRIKVLQYMASRGQFWFVKLHYYLVVKFIYGVIYK